MPFGAGDRPKNGVRAARAVCALAVIFGAATQAQDRFGGSLAITSDYVYRGVSLSRGRVAYQAGAHLRLPAQWQVGVWGSTIEAVDRQGTPIEAIGSVARSWTLTENWSARVSYSHYAYFGLPASNASDYDELTVSLAFRSQLSLAVSWAPNVATYGAPPQYTHSYQSADNRKSAFALEAAWLQPVWLDLAATAGIGYHDLSDLYGRAYFYWHVGLTGPVGPFEFDLLHINSDDNASLLYGRQATGQRWAALARWRF